MDFFHVSMSNEGVMPYKKLFGPIKVDRFAAKTYFETQPADINIYYIKLVLYLKFKTSNQTIVDFSLKQTYI